MLKKIIYSFIISFIFISSATASDRSGKEKQAYAAAEKWIASVDSENYSEVWNGASDLLKNAVKKEQFEASLKSSRQAFGKLLSRKEKNRVYKTSLPGAPDGEYVIFIFESSFENKKSALETLTLMLDKNDIWKTAGYYIK